ncbi:MAG: hypothetical protein H6624_00220 [Bdellovibrionaceae bacterium]|nr:hypothetical protein [Bdellovibrionales bacterium]MCB9082731.1 hypothetical protein [Pseudobdellovibrionaceae bacterium]
MFSATLQKILLCALAVNLFTFAERAGAQIEVQSEFSFQLGNQEYEQILTSGLGEINESWEIPVPDFTIGQPYATSVKGIKALVKSQVNGVSHHGPEVGLRLEIPEMNFQIDRVETSQLIEQVINGVRVRVHIQGSCEGISAKLIDDKVQADLRLSRVIQPSKLHWNLEDLFITNQNWRFELSIARCHAPQGYEAILKDEIQRYLEQTALWQGTVQGLIQEKVDQWSAQVSSQLLMAAPIDLGFTNFKMIMVPESLDENARRDLIIRGHIHGHFPNSRAPAQVLKVEFDQGDGGLDGSEGTALAVPPRLIANLLGAFSANGELYRTIRFQEVEGLRDLMRSRWYQFFLWPDLMNYSKKTNFALQIFGRQAPHVSEVSSLDGVLRGTFYWPMSAKMFLPWKGNFVSYMDFQTDFRALPEMEVKSDGIHVRFPHPSMTLEYQWDQNYLSQFYPWTHFAHKSIGSRIKDVVEEVDWILPLPQLKVKEKLVLKAKRFHYNASSLQIIFQK